MGSGPPFRWRPRFALSPTFSNTSMSLAWLRTAPEKTELLRNQKNKTKKTTNKAPFRISLIATFAI